MPVIEKATERRKLYGAKTILFVKDVRESLNWPHRNGAVLQFAPGIILYSAVFSNCSFCKKAFMF